MYKLCNATGYLLVIAFIIAAGYGYIANGFALYNCDFKEPYKAEIIRTLGVFVAPLGTFLGYVTIKDGE